jgi:hypothetical protein
MTHPPTKTYRRLDSISLTVRLTRCFNSILSHELNLILNLCSILSTFYVLLNLIRHSVSSDMGTRKCTP